MPLNGLIIRMLTGIGPLAAWCLVMSGCAVYAPPMRETATLGWLEKVYLSPGNIVLHAKLDSGADNSSLHAQNITLVRSNNGAWVSFDLHNRYGEQRRLELKVYRFTKIKTKDGRFQKRPVVRMGLCLGSRYQIVEFSLVDRSHFAYPVLVGRNFLAGAVLVDSAETYQSEPMCAVLSPEDDEPLSVD